MDCSTIAQQVEFKNVGEATSSSTATFSSSPSTASSGSTACSSVPSTTTDQGAQASKPSEATVQGKSGKHRPNETCTAKTRARKGRFLRWLLEPAKWAVSCLRLRPGKRGKGSNGSIQRRLVCNSRCENRV